MPGAVTNTEYARDRVFSSYQYVSAELLVKELPGDHKYQKIVLRNSPEQCNHTSTVCKWCWFMWEWGYELIYSRTVGGRRLEADRVHDNNPLRDA